MKQLIKKLIREDNFLSLAGNLLIAIFGLCGFAILARMLSIEVFGEWVLFIAGASFIEMFRFGITGNGLVRFLSGATSEYKRELIASNALVGLIASITIALLLLGCNLFLKPAFIDAGFGLFVQYYPFLILVNLPWNNAINVLQAARFF